VTGVVAAAFSGDLLIGLILGTFLGFLVGPLIRAWLSWREWVSASRAAHLGPSRDVDVFADLVDRLDVEEWPVVEDPLVRGGSLPGEHRDPS
jgi:hypothetical protein